MNGTSEDRWRNYPPLRPDWRDLEGEEFNKCYLDHQRKACRFLLDRDIPEPQQDSVYRLWKRISDEKKDTILDFAMQGHPVMPNCDLDDRVRTGDIAYDRVVCILVSMLEKARKLRKQGAGSNAPLKGGNPLLRRAILNSQSGK